MMQLLALAMLLVVSAAYADSSTNPFPNCKLAATCGQTEAYSCPGNRMFYADAATHKLAATCPQTCTDFKKEWCEQNCPPKDWTCPKPEPVK